MNKLKEIQNNLVRDICSISVAPAAKSEVRRLVELAFEEVIEKFVKLADEIELSQPDGGTKQWKAFKHFRNTLRDMLKHE